MATCRGTVSWLAVLLALAPAMTGDARPEDPDFAAVLAAVDGEVRIHRDEWNAPRAATVGRRLRVGDTVETGRDSAASIYLSGGQLLEVLGGSRVRITIDLAGRQDGASTLAALSTDSLRVLERGVWVLSDPHGSLLVGGMRSASEDPGSDVVLLSPREEELVLAERPTFYWIGEMPEMSVVVARGDEVLWTSRTVDRGPVVYPSDAPVLPVDVDLAWWLRAADGSRRTLRSTSFRMAGEAARGRVREFECTLKDLALRGADGNTATFLRAAFYGELRAWGAMLDLAHGAGPPGTPRRPDPIAADRVSTGTGLEPEQVHRLSEMRTTVANPLTGSRSLPCEDS